MKRRDSESQNKMAKNYRNIASKKQNNSVWEILANFANILQDMKENIKISSINTSHTFRKTTA